MSKFPRFQVGQAILCIFARTLISEPVLGAVKRVPKNQCQDIAWKNTAAAATMNAPVCSPSSVWNQGVSVEAVSRDKCQLGSWVLAQHETLVCGIMFVLHVNLHCFLEG